MYSIRTITPMALYRIVPIWKVWSIRSVTVHCKQTYLARVQQPIEHKHPPLGLKPRKRRNFRLECINCQPKGQLRGVKPELLQAQVLSFMRKERRNFNILKVGKKERNVHGGTQSVKSFSVTCVLLVRFK